MEPNTDILAKISPRYKLQYKIDVALQQLHQQIQLQELPHGAQTLMSDQMTSFTASSMPFDEDNCLNNCDVFAQNDSINHAEQDVIARGYVSDDHKDTEIPQIKCDMDDYQPVTDDVYNSPAPQSIKKSLQTNELASCSNESHSELDCSICALRKASKSTSDNKTSKINSETIDIINRLICSTSTDLHAVDTRGINSSNEVSNDDGSMELNKNNASGNNVEVLLQTELDHDGNEELESLNQNISLPIIKVDNLFCDVSSGNHTAPLHGGMREPLIAAETPTKYIVGTSEVRTHAEIIAPDLARAVVNNGIVEAARTLNATAGCGDEQERSTEVGDDPKKFDVQEKVESSCAESQTPSTGLLEEEEVDDETIQVETRDLYVLDEVHCVSECEEKNISDDSGYVYVNADIGEDFRNIAPACCDENDKMRKVISEHETTDGEVTRNTIGAKNEENSNTANRKRFLISPDFEDEEMETVEQSKLGNQIEDSTNYGNVRRSHKQTYNKRNTDATKWFGQPKPKDKVWLKPSGKVDEDAENERRRVIKAMTKKHNPDNIQSWQPPVVKDWTDELTQQQRESLERYEERRQIRIKSEESFVEIENFEVPDSPFTAQQEVVHSNSQIVEEPIVNSRDAITIWEERLNKKIEKEKSEEKILSFGRMKRSQREAKEGRKRCESMTSDTYTVNDLPSSEFVIRESMSISSVRNRWRDREDQCKENKSHTNFSKLIDKPKRSRSFSVNTGSTYRSYSKPSTLHTAMDRPVVNAKYSYKSKSNESFIDKEIRETAEREEMWKNESASSGKGSVPTSPRVMKEYHKVDDDLSETSATTNHNFDESENVEKVIKENKKENQVNTIEPPIVPIKAKRVIDDTQALNKFNLEKHFDGECVATDDVKEDGANRSFSHSTTESFDQSDYGADSGIECNAVSYQASISYITSPTSGDTDRSTPTQTSTLSDLYNASHDKSLPVSTTPQEDIALSRDRILPIVSSPRGWDVKPAVVSPVTPKLRFKQISPSPEQREVVDVIPQTHEQSITSSPIIHKVNGNEHNAENMYIPKAKPRYSSESKVVNNDLKENQTTKVTVTHKRSGPSFEILSSKNCLQTIMEREMKEAEKREKEWRSEQLEVLNHEHDASRDEITSENVATQMNDKSASKTAENIHKKLEESQKSIDRTNIEKDVVNHTPLTNGDASDRLTNHQDGEKSDETIEKIKTGYSAEYRKNTVVKANRVPRRQSNLAKLWEAGNFKNNEE